MRRALVMLILVALAVAGCSGGSKRASTATAPAAATQVGTPPSPPGVTPTVPPATIEAIDTTVAGARTAVAQEQQADLVAVRDCLADVTGDLQRTSSLLDGCLNAGEGGFTLAPVPGDVPLIIVEHPGNPGTCRSTDVIVWRGADAWQSQLLTPLLPDPVDDRLLGGATSLYGALQRRPADLIREGAVGHTTLLSVLALTASCGSGPSMEVLLFALDGGTWHLAWDPRGSEMTTLTDATAEFADASGIDHVHLRGDLWGVGPAGGIFHESHPGPHRISDQAWTLDKERYVLSSSTVEPSAYATLVNFIYALSTDDDAGATKLLADASLLGTAKRLGLTQRPLGQQWSTNLDSMTVCCGPIHIFSGPEWHGGPPQPIVVTFVQRDGDWLISRIDVDLSTPVH